MYGRSLHCYCLIQGLIQRGVQPCNITLAIPRIYCHVNESEETSVEQDIPVIYPDAFDDEKIQAKIEEMLELKGVTIQREAKLIEIITDKDRERENSKGATDADASTSGAKLEKVVFKRLDIPDNEEEEEDEIEIDEKSQDDKSEKDDEDGNMSDVSGNDDDENEEDQNAVKKKKRKRNEQEVECGVLITCGHKDVD